MLALAWLMVVACQPEPAETPPPVDVPVDPGPATVRRLTQAQYENAITDVFGEGLFIPAEIEPDQRVLGLQALGASRASISPRGVERYEEAARAIAEQVVSAERRAATVTCAPAGVTDDVCAGNVLGSLGARLWRRALTADELGRLVTISREAASTLGDFHVGLAYGISALLQAPDFLMRPEVGAEADGVGAITGAAMASRLSFFLWNSVPDEALLADAASGALDSPEGVRVAARRMLADPKARRGMSAWLTDLLHLDEVVKLYKEPSVFVHMSDQVGPSAREETLRGFLHLVFEEDGDLRDLITTRRTFIDRTLAAIYAVPAPAREGFGEVWLPEDEPRAGLLGQVAILAQHAHPTSTSATLRGRFIRETLLCQTIPAPPADVNTAIPEPSPELPTLRDRIAVHLENRACAVCHEKMDPIGLGLEPFDGIGRYRVEENDVRIDASGVLDGASFTGPVGLAQAVRNHPEFVPCLTRQVTRYALGREVVPGEEAALDALTAGFAASGHRLSALVEELVAGPLFRDAGVAPTQEEAP